MYNLSTMFRLSLLLFIVLSAYVFAQPPANWPVKGEVDLSSGFGDYRTGGRFHMGVDIRTGGKTGRPVESPVDGYVWRVRLSCYGSGKAVYIKGDDGLIYIYYHLSGFSGPVNDIVSKEQLRLQRY